MLSLAPTEQFAGQRSYFGVSWDVYHSNKLYRMERTDKTPECLKTQPYIFDTLETLLRSSIPTWRNVTHNDSWSELVPYWMERAVLQPLM